MPSYRSPNGCDGCQTTMIGITIRRIPKTSPTQLAVLPLNISSVRPNRLPPEAAMTTALALATFRHRGANDLELSVLMSLSIPHDVFACPTKHKEVHRRCDCHHTTALSVMKGRGTQRVHNAH